MDCSLSTLEIVDYQGKKALKAGPEEHYDNEDHWSLRGKFLTIIFLSIPSRFIPQFLYRAADIVNVFTRGYNRAVHEHLSKMKEHSDLIGTAVPYCEIACSTLVELVICVLRCAFFNLYIDLIAVIAFVGIFLPLDARRLMQRLDALFYVHPVDPYQKMTDFERISNLHAPCMQTKEFRHENNMYRASNKPYSPYTTHSLRLRLMNELTIAKGYFNYELQDIQWLTETLKLPTSFETEAQRILKTDNFDPRRMYNNDPASNIRVNLLLALDELESARLSLLTNPDVKVAHTHLDRIEEILSEVNDCDPRTCFLASMLMDDEQS